MLTNKLKLNMIALVIACAVSIGSTWFIAGCSDSPEQIARDTIAASRGAIQAAQAQYQVACTADPAQSQCVLINRAIAGQHFAIASLDTYCQFAPSDDPAKVCQPLESAVPALRSAISNLNNLTTAVKGIIQ